MSFFTNIAQHLLNLVYPKNCCICKENLIGNEEEICTACLYHIPRTNFHLQKDNAIEKRFWGKANIERATAFFFFQKGSDFRELLHLLKYKGEQQIGVVLGEFAAADLLQSPDFSGIDFLVPVPLHHNKLRQRGYNQSECIARGLSQVLNIPIDAKNLFRVIENPTQTKKSVYERWENTNGIFDIVDAKIFENKHILLIDDVLTTGSTLVACVEALQKTKNIKISIFTLAVA